MYTLIQFALGVVAILGIAFFFCKNKTDIEYQNLPKILIAELLTAWFFLKSDIGVKAVAKISDFFQILMSFAHKGTEFVFGNLINTTNGFNFFLNALVPIVFMSALIGILSYTKILNKIILVLGYVLDKISGMGKLESYNALNAMMLGQSENFISYKDTLKDMSKAQMFTLSATAMSTISMSIVGTYMLMIPAKLVVAGLFLNMFSTFAILTIINPYKKVNDVAVISSNNSETFFEMLSEYIVAGFKIAVIVAAMLIGFISLISMLDSTFLALFGMSFQTLLGYLFSPFALIMGIPPSEAVNTGSIMATKLVSNEFVAMQSLQNLKDVLSAQSFETVCVFLISFANLSSIGIIAGAVKAVDENQGNVAARFGLKLVFTSTLVSMLSATFAHIFVG
ncbi:NupC/NupG family nucleoside CNT transporter [Photobacterium damselae]|uniref:NupC/NupG family nucleoside CNT transporter n=1 Tax=Photobacterium damselae TaxID=38293 RepID=UPI001F241EEE|nr:nucleoside transporter C-terminal domain-containing protein [Photobacterium damselae]UKA04517.1 NupC/NupG family nucleoside CNT transporter [Photobacterium damselae subsp. damselae]